jgi:hypothetical protein
MQRKRQRDRERKLEDASQSAAAGGRRVPKRPPSEVLALPRVDREGQAVRAGVGGPPEDAVQGARAPGLPQGPGTDAGRPPPDDELLEW